MLSSPASAADPTPWAPFTPSLPTPRSRSSASRRAGAARATAEPGPLDAGLPLRPRRQGHVDSAADAPRARALMSPRERIAHAIKSAAASGEPALLAYLTAGYPQREKFREQVRALAA